jgi:hypothetical protein
MRKSHPYVMRGAPAPTAQRATVLDKPDHRVPSLHVRALTIEEIHIITREAATDPRLRAIDRCFERWAATPGETGSPGLAHVVVFRRDDGGAPPLDDLESKIVDTAVRTSPGWARTFVQLWYRSDCSVTEIATQLAIKRREYVYDERKVVLSYYLGRLSEVAGQLNLTG